MQQICLPTVGTFKSWRMAARGLLAARVPPDAVLWSRGEAVPDLFAETSAPTMSARQAVPRRFLDLAEHVIWHRDPERFARLYGCLWRLTRHELQLSDRGDPAIAKLNALAKEVRRDKHKMTAFVRFREISDAGGKRRRFAAWFEPSNYIAEPIAPFFANRFGDMDWTIFTPDLTVSFVDGGIGFSDGQPRPPLPDDATEDLWRTYFRNIFNPARLMVKAMQSEMPKKYWKNMPEAALIPELIETAHARAKSMAEAAPTMPPARAGRITKRLHTVQRAISPDVDRVLSDLAACRRCPLWKSATQAVPGEGPRDARIMIVGEQPGDQEDLSGRPFVGPAGQVLDAAMARAGLDRSAAYVTNAVKHFKYTAQGKRRVHQTPTSDEIHHCRWWLDVEMASVRPDLVIALGGTALESLTGTRHRLLKRRGHLDCTPDGTPILVTVHPSYLLRLPAGDRSAQEARFVADLTKAREALEAMNNGFETSA